MKNAYIYIPDTTTLDNVKSELKKFNISNEKFSVIKPSVSSGDISIANDQHLKESRDLIPAILRGLSIGLLISLITIAVINYLQIEYIEIGPITAVTLMMLFMLVGSFFSSMIGVSVNHPDVDYFNKELKKGGVLMVLKLSSKEQAILYKNLLYSKFSNVKILIDDVFKINPTASTF